MEQLLARIGGWKRKRGMTHQQQAKDGSGITTSGTNQLLSQ
ncbi:hypothetical protein [Herbaspirillum frisingense]|nr:hypothetical protein [Herbaspirillum frisingense]